MRVLESPIVEENRGVVGSLLVAAAENGNGSGVAAHEDSIGGYVPRTELGRKLLKLRQQYAAEGGKFLSREELDEEVARRRLGFVGTS